MWRQDSRRNGRSIETLHEDVARRLTARYLDVTLSGRDVYSIIRNLEPGDTLTFFRSKLMVAPEIVQLIGGGS